MSERIAQALIHTARSPRDLAKEIGVSTARISQLKSGTGGVKAENLFALARATGYSPQWLAEGVGQEKLVNSLGVQFVNVPRYEANTGSELNHLAFDRAWLEDMVLNIKALRYIRYQDSTMEPSISDTDVLLIDTAQTEPENDAIFLLIRRDGGTVAKRLLKTLAGSWMIRSDGENKRHYPDEIVSEDAISNLSIAGRIVWRGGKT